MPSRLRLTVLLVLPLATACDPPICEDDVLPAELATDVVLELRGADRAARPVFVQDRDGAVLEAGETDADGRFVLGRAPGNATLTVDVAPDRLDSTYATHLVSYVGLSSGDRLVYQDLPAFSRADGEVAITVRFAQLDDPRVSNYQFRSGPGCAALLPLPHDAASPTAVREITMERCHDTAVRFDVIATDATDRFVGVASARFEVGEATALTIEAGAWQTRTATVRFTGELAADASFDVMAHAPGGIPVWYWGTVDGPLLIPDLPELFDRIDVQVSSGAGTYEVSIADPSDFTIDAADLLPAIEAFELDNVQSGAPTVSWRYLGPMQAAIAHYEIEDTELIRTAIRVDGGCHITFPPLPEAYRNQVPGPRDEFHVWAGVALVHAPDLDDPHDLLRPFEVLPVGTGVATVGRSASVTLYESPDPS